MKYETGSDWSICRTCLKGDEDGEEMISIFDKDDTEIIIADKIMECAGVTINQDANLPEEICKKCLTFLSISYTFRVTCRNSDEMLQSFDLIDIKPDINELDEDRVEDAPESGTENQEKIVAIEWKPAESDTSHDNDDNAKPVVEMKKKRTGKRRRTPRENSTGKRPGRKPHPKQPVICDVCGNIYKSNTMLKSHMIWHRQDKPFGCEVCSMAFPSGEQLKRHMRTHTGEKPYGCQYCGKKFSLVGSKHRHERTHTGERPFSCDICGKSFTYSHALHIHNRTHTGEKRFHCADCGKEFTCAHHLKAHLTTLIHQESVNKQQIETQKVTAKGTKSEKVQYAGTQVVDMGDNLDQQINMLFTAITEDQELND